AHLAPRPEAGRSRRRPGERLARLPESLRAVRLPKTSGGNMATQASAPSASRAALIVAFCCMAALGEGFELQTPGVTMPVLPPLFHPTTGQGFVGGFFSSKSLFASMSTFGLMVGAMIGGRASDLIGRKWVTVVSVALFAAFSAATAHAPNADLLLW